MCSSDLGLTIAGASAISHDIYANILRHGQASDEEVVRVSRIAALGLGVLGIVLGIAFKGQNIAYLIVLPFTISSTVFFPVLFLCMYWRRLTTTGVVAGGWLGLASGVLMLVAGLVPVERDVEEHRALPARQHTQPDAPSRYTHAGIQPDNVARRRA